MTAAAMAAPAAPPVSVDDLAQALTLAAEHADAVDREPRFPHEALAALRAAGALGWYVPAEFGGPGASFPLLCEATLELSRRCSATGMIFAMHQIQVASIVHHHGDSAWFRHYLRMIAAEQRLIASATSEVGVGGEMRRSLAAVLSCEDGSGLMRFEKQASTISYGAHADDLLTTVRRHETAEGSDQVLILTHVNEASMRQTTEWDTLGMRGTCSPGFVVNATFPAEQILPVPFAEIAAETVVPFSHLLWAHVWLGIAIGAFDRAQNFVRQQARQKPGLTPPAALPLSHLSTKMAEFRALVKAATQEYAVMIETGDRAPLSTIGYAVRINNVKIAASEAAAECCQMALRVCGILGYKNGGPFSIGRALRDALSAALMVANDRIHATNAALLLVHREGR